jgi:hypothetical protein
MYHVVGGKVYCNLDGFSLEDYKAYVRKAYGNLRGVKFVMAKDRNQALDKAANNKTI